MDTLDRNQLTGPNGIHAHRKYAYSICSLSACLQFAASPTAEPSNSGGQHADFEVSVRSYLPNLAQSIFRFLSCV